MRIERAHLQAIADEIIAPKPMAPDISKTPFIEAGRVLANEMVKEFASRSSAEMTLHGWEQLSDVVARLLSGTLYNIAYPPNYHGDHDFSIGDCSCGARQIPVEDGITAKSCPNRLPHWRCHKVVQADKITAVEVTHTGLHSFLVLKCGARIKVTDGLLDRVPESHAIDSGYYVRYADGYESWSPAKAFEEGYTRI